MALNNFCSVANIVINKKRQTCYIFLMELKYGEGWGWGAGTFPILFFQSLSFLHLETTLFKIVLCI